MEERVVYAGNVLALERALGQRLGAGALQAEPARTYRRVDLDTIERSLEQSGASLCWTARDPGGLLAWTSSGEASLQQPLGAPPAFWWELVSGPLRVELARAAGPRRLLALRDVEERERVVRRLDERGKTVVRLRILRRRYRSPAGAGSWSPTEELTVVEPVRGYGAELAALCRVLEGIPGLDPVRGETPGARPAPVLPVAFDPPPAWPSVDLGEPAARVLRRIALRQLEVVEAQEAGLRADLDSEFLHDLRVAIRRTRSLLAQLKAALDPGEVDGLRAELAWIGRVSGPLRDLDVLGLELRSLDDELARPLQPLVRLLDQRREASRRALLEALDSPRWEALRSAWRRWAGGAGPLDGPAFGALLAERVRRLADRIRRSGRWLDLDAPAEDLHALRIECKKLRYLLECVRAAIPCEEHARSVRALKGLQQVLGDFNDARLQAAELAGWAGTLAGSAPLALLALGRLVEQRRTGEREARAHFAERLAAFCSKSVRRDLRRLGALLRGQEEPVR